MLLRGQAHSTGWAQGPRCLLVAAERRGYRGRVCAGLWVEARLWVRLWRCRHAHPDLPPPPECTQAPGLECKPLSTSALSVVVCGREVGSTGSGSPPLLPEWPGYAVQLSVPQFPQEATKSGLLGTEPTHQKRPAAAW